MKCPSCGYENREDAPYCDICQTPFNPPQTDNPVTTPTLEAQALQQEDADNQTEELNYYQHQTN
jgi:hypothetical protein